MIGIELITDALREIGVLDALSDPNPEDATLSLRKLNTLMATLKRIERIDVGYFAQTDVNAELPISDDDAALIMPLLAMALKINFPSAIVPDALPAWAANCHSALVRDAVLENAQEALLTNLPRGSAQCWRGNILTGE